MLIGCTTDRCHLTIHLEIFISEPMGPKHDSPNCNSSISRDLALTDFGKVLEILTPCKATHKNLCHQQRSDSQLQTARQ